MAIESVCRIDGRINQRALAAERCRPPQQTTREIGHAMLSIARYGYGKHILETHDIRAVVNR